MRSMEKAMAKRVKLVPAINIRGTKDSRVTSPNVRRIAPEAEAVRRAAEPFREFMLANTRDEDLDLFADLSRERGADPGTAEDVAWSVLAPAFLISEIRRGFEIGFLIVLPFLVIDLVVATVTMSMGMMMLPPTVISLPFKVMFFVLMDGWNLLVGAMVRSVAA